MNLPFNPRSPKTQALVAIVLGLFLLGAATTCRGAEPELQFGIGSSWLRGQAPVLDMAVVYPKAGPGDADYLLGVTLVGQSHYYGETQRNQIFWRAQIIEGFGKFDVGIGVAVKQNDDGYNTGPLQFALSVGYRFGRVGAQELHFSNSGTRYPNAGRDLAIASWRFAL